MHFSWMLQATRVRERCLLGAALLPLLFGSGCATMNNTERGMLTGGGLGGVTGALIGSAVGKTGAGAAIGAGVGAVSGGLIGNGIDESERRQEVRLAAATAAPPPPARGPLGLTDIAQMSQQGVGDDVIINQIRSTGSTYHLSSNDIIWLNQNGVSKQVILEMQHSVPPPAPRVYHRRVTPVYVEPPPCERVYIVRPAPCPPPPCRVGFGIGFHHHH